jgi:preprotein translocase subunit SecD
MSGGVVTDAKDSFDQLGKPSVSMQMNGQGAKAWEELTGRAYTKAILLSFLMISYIIQVYLADLFQVVDLKSLIV